MLAVLMVFLRRLGIPGKESITSHYLKRITYCSSSTFRRIFKQGGKALMQENKVNMKGDHCSPVY